jgi:hypothetical protein
MRIVMAAASVLMTIALSSHAGESKQASIARARKAAASAEKCQAVANAVEAVNDPTVTKESRGTSTWAEAAGKVAAAATVAAEQAATASTDEDATAAADRAEALAKKAEDLAKTAGEPKPLDYPQLTKNASDAFAGINFSLGMGASLGGVEEVFEASVEGAVAADPEEKLDGVPGVVRVTRRGKSRPRLLLEAHKFPWTKNRKVSGSSFHAAQFGLGPFVAIQSSESELLESFGLGLMGGVRLGDTDKTSLNFGIGAMLDPNVQTLGQGIVEGEPLPTGETEVRFNMEAKWRLLILASFTF